MCSRRRRTGMRVSRWLALGAVAAIVAAIPAQAGAAAPGKATYVVVYRDGTSAAKAHAANRAAGGKPVHENRRVGVATVVSSNARFLRNVTRQKTLVGASRNRAIGYASPKRDAAALTDAE